MNNKQIYEWIMVLLLKDYYEYNIFNASFQQEIERENGMYLLVVVIKHTLENEFWYHTNWLRDLQYE